MITFGGHKVERTAVPHNGDVVMTVIHDVFHSSCEKNKSSHHVHTMVVHAPDGYSKLQSAVIR